MRFTSTLCFCFLAHAEEDATYLLQSQVLRAVVSDHQNGTSLGYMTCPAFTGQNCPENDLRKDFANSAGECCDKCHAEPACAGYVFNTKHECWLKRACQVPNRRADDVISAGPIYRTHANGNVCPAVSRMNCAHNDIKNEFANSAEECCDKCHATSGCGGFVYNTQRVCWMKTGCDNPTQHDGSVLASGPIQRAPPPPPTPPTPPTPPPTPPPTLPVGCSGYQPRCGGVVCVNGVWTCGGFSPGTDSPGGDTEVTDADCLDAAHGFGPGFTCASTEMYCSTDSGDGMTVGACCPTKCKKEFENKKKNNRAENKAKNDIERRMKRNENERSRKQAEKARKKSTKDKEWQNKRDLKEAKNKNEEGERKNKRGLTENARKNEQTWKKNQEARRKAGNQRENSRKEKRGKSAPAPTPVTKKCRKKLGNWKKCAARKKCERGQKKKGKSAPSC